LHFLVILISIHSGLDKPPTKGLIMNSVSLADAIEPLLSASADDVLTRKTLDVIRTLYNGLVTQDQQGIEAIATAVAETQEYSPEYNAKHGLHPNTTRMHDPTYG
jgi:hypothetical protein